MPNYNYCCEFCEHEFTENLKISERNEPLEKPCPECLKSNGVAKMVSSPAICDPILVGVTRPSKGFQSGVLDRIKRNNKSNFDH